MTELILHIGLPKCGSTTIQKFLSDKEGYLGRGSKDAMANKICTEFLRCSHVNRLSRVRVQKLVKWKEMVMEYSQLRSLSEESKFILSSEVLAKTKNDYSNLFLFIDQLNKIKQFDNVKVLITLRQQSTKLASEYSQVSYRRFNASQADFDKFVTSKIRKEYLDYDKLVFGLNLILGSDNVKVLFMEEMNGHEFWDELTNFCGVKNINYGHSVSLETRANKKSVGNDSWLIQKPCSEVHSRGFAISVLTWFWPHWIMQKKRDSAKILIEKIYRFLCPLLFIFERHREDSIFLKEDVRKLIEKRYSESNRNLEKIIGRKVGY